MGNLRIKRIRASANNAIRVEFSDSLDDLIGIANIDVEPVLTMLPKPQVIKVVVRDDLLYITTNLLTPFANYKITFQSTQLQRFSSKNGLNYLLEDGKNNISYVQGLAQPNSTVTNALKAYLSDNIYNLDGSNLVSKIIESQGEFLSRALFDIGQAANDNYLEHLIVDEPHVRGNGPWDRLNQEGAFEIVRVGLSEADYSLSKSLSFDLFPSNRITLQQVPVSQERLVAGTVPGTFNGLILTVNNGPVVKLSSVTIVHQSGLTEVYDVTTLGYQMLNPEYDSDYASKLFTLEDNQFKLSDNIFETMTPPVAGDLVIVDYLYKALGLTVSEESVVLSEVMDAIREVAPPITTEFSLEHAPVVTAQDSIAEIGELQFFTSNSCIPFSETHPAFINEISYSPETLPVAPGEFCIDYENGRVFVYGESTNDGTGIYPPVITYKYRKTFVPNLDYTYNPELQEVVASPTRDVAGREIKISFDYQMVLVPNVDYIGNVHVEELNERIDNRLASLTSLYTEHVPITNVFRVYNETTGEVYPVNRFSDTSIYFSSNQYPRINEIDRERATFTDVLNEVLIVNSETTNTGTVRIFELLLENNRIIGSTDDVVGSSFNTSVLFSRTDIFGSEWYFDGQTSSVSENIDKLSVGEYTIDYLNGIVYVGVANDQIFDLGTINYKKPTITTNNKHIISVSELYYSIIPNSISFRLDYSSFNDTEISPNVFDIADERFLNEDTTLPYQLINRTITVSDDVKSVRGIFDLYDLNNNIVPMNFAEGATVSGNVISLGSDGQNIQETNVVAAGLIINLPFISDGISVLEVNSVLRVSDSEELWDGLGTINGYELTLSGVNTPVPGDSVIVNYQIQLNGGSTPVVDYNRGDYYIDYSYLADEILVSYEWGDNVIDFRESTTVEEGTEYYVTYKVGALRDALLANFGTLVDLPIMQSFDTSLPREYYRNALQGALQSFTKGPTIPALKLLVKSITKIDPDIEESVFDIWTLGTSSLYPDAINYTGDLQLTAGKFDQGVLIENSDETITFPVSSNIRLEEGTMEMFVIPNWSGLDNDSTLTFTDLLVDGHVVADSDIYIGSDSHHPTISGGQFSISRFDEEDPSGLPSAIHLSNNGVFIYYDITVKRWNFLVKNTTATYTGYISTSGEFYDVKHIQDLGESGDSIRSLTNEIKFSLNCGNDITLDGYMTGDGYVDGYTFDGITFMSDNLHYLFDFGEPQEIPEGLIGTIEDRLPHPAEIEALRRLSKNRMSIYKDGRGYLSFAVYDKNSRLYKVSADISSWLPGQIHFVATSWKINSYDGQDEIHLFVDGTEVPNILRYGGRPIAAAGDRFRTVKPEIIVGTIPKKIICGSDLSTVAGENVVYSASIDFQAESIVVGDTIDILEIGFGVYNILGVTDNSLLLDGVTPTTLTDARFSVNEFASVVSNEVDLSANVAVSILSGGTETELPGVRAEFPAYSIEKNALLQTVLTIYGPAEVGDQVYIRTLGLNHRRCRDTVYLWGDLLSVLKTRMPTPINLDEVSVTAVIQPITNVGPDNAVIIGTSFVLSGIVPSKVTNETEGRTLAVRVTGGNVDFSSPVYVFITGVTSVGPAMELLEFSTPSIQNTPSKWRTITDVTVIVTPVSLLARSISFEIKEAFSVTNAEGNTNFPIIRYSYQDNSGAGLYGFTSGLVSGGVFSDRDIGKKLIIDSPAAVAGTYTITDIDENRDITVDPVPVIDFTDGVYRVYNTTIGRSGFQNGFFTFELSGSVAVAYPLPQGRYEFDYAAWLEIPFINLEDNVAFIGSDFYGHNQARAIIDEFRVLSRMITDVRIGETIAAGEKSVTTDYMTLRPFVSDSETLMLLHFDELPLENSAEFYKIANKDFMQTASSVNGDFYNSLVITESPYVVENIGLLSTVSEGTIEFWVSPRFDTFNDPVERYYFDSAAAAVEDVVSLTAGTVKIVGRTSNVLSVTLLNDPNGQNFFAGGSIAGDFQTINLGTALPFTQTPVKVSYVPHGSYGDRISIIKDQYGALIFRVVANGQQFEVRQSIFWQRNTWHRVFATFKFNRRDNQDQLRLFVDGREINSIMLGTGLILGTGIVFGQQYVGSDEGGLIVNMDFRDTLNNFYIGSSFRETNIAAARFDNFKISNIARNPLVCSGISVDANFQTNVDIVKPVVSDLYTSYLMDFNRLIEKNEDFTTLRDEQFGMFNFIINVIDSFRIVSDSAKMDQILRELIAALKPGHSKATINVIS